LRVIEICSAGTLVIAALPMIWPR